MFFKQAKIEGSTMGSPSDFRAMMHFIDEKSLVPVVSDVFSLADCADAFEVGTYPK
jgi:D-arabinose 1-dehydrogenase-like Zn-dependent alcohol dehydrogenase